VKDLIVMKFGGTSMGSAERIQSAADICAAQSRSGPIVVVVSAMSKVTDLLLDTLRLAENGDRAGAEASIQKLRDRHVETCRQLLPIDKQERVLCAIYDMVAEFGRIAQGMIMLRERPPRSVDEAVALGERLSVLLLSSYLEVSGTPAVGVNAWDIVVTDDVFGNASPLMGPTREKARKHLLTWLQSGVIPVVTGFNGATVDGRPTTLGRGGSDFSASILASALDAKELWIWSDVDGIMTADPRLVPKAGVLDVVSYREAAELAYNGAKVLHPRTLAPLVEKQIPVWSKNSFDTSKPGTRIVPTVDVPGGPRAVTSMTDVALVSVELGVSGPLNATAIMGRTLEAIAHTNTEVLALSSSSYRQSFCFLVRKAELRGVLSKLEAEFALELAHGYLNKFDVDDQVGLLAVVGEGMRGTPGLAGRIFTAISRHSINIKAIAQGASELTIAIVVHRSGVETAVQAIHEECHMGVPPDFRATPTEGAAV
jgi:bifunctional aspartokinase / homoserine dehydrogenase 1